MSAIGPKRTCLAPARNTPCTPKRCGAPLTAIKRCKVSKRLEARKEKIGAALQGGEGRQAGDFLPDRTHRNFEFERPVLSTDDWVMLVGKLVKIPVVYPNVLREFELPDETRADHESGNAAFYAILRSVLRQMRAVGGAAANHAPTVEVRCAVGGVQAAYIRPARHGIPMGIHLLVVEVVIPLRIGAECRIVFLGRQYERRAAAPAAH